MQNPSISYEKSIPVKYTVDVFVAGGGPAGIAAAIAAARQGSRVYLAEAGGSFGGSGTIGLVPSFAQFTDGEHFLEEKDADGKKVYSSLTASAGKSTKSCTAIPPERRSVDSSPSR